MPILWRTSFGEMDTRIAVVFRNVLFFSIFMFILTVNSISIIRLLIVQQVVCQYIKNTNIKSKISPP